MLCNHLKSENLDSTAQCNDVSFLSFDAIFSNSHIFRRHWWRKWSKAGKQYSTKRRPSIRKGVCWNSPDRTPRDHPWSEFREIRWYASLLWFPLSQFTRDHFDFFRELYFCLYNFYYKLFFESIGGLNLLPLWGDFNLSGVFSARRGFESVTRCPLMLVYNVAVFASIAKGLLSVSVAGYCFLPFLDLYTLVV